MSELKREIVKEDVPRIHELVKLAAVNGKRDDGTFNPNKEIGTSLLH